MVCGEWGVGVWEGHEWVWVVGEWAGTEHWLHFHMLVSLWDSGLTGAGKSKLRLGQRSRLYGWKKATVSSICLVSFRAPATHGRLLATELSSRGSRAKPSVLGPGALGVKWPKRPGLPAIIGTPLPQDTEAWSLCCGLSSPVVETPGLDCHHCLGLGAPEVGQAGLRDCPGGTETRRQQPPPHLRAPPSWKARKNMGIDHWMLDTPQPATKSSRCPEGQGPMRTGSRAY